jgi:hypothetical protein
VVPTTSFKEDITKAMIKRCKANAVSISSAMFAVCNIAWARMCPREKQELPVWVIALFSLSTWLANGLIQADVLAD